jgi:hypothetical protein
MIHEIIQWSSLIDQKLNWLFKTIDAPLKKDIAPETYNISCYFTIQANVNNTTDLAHTSSKVP